MTPNHNRRSALKTILIVLTLLSAVVLVAGCKAKYSAPPAAPPAGEAISDSTSELDNGLQEVDNLNQMDQDSNDVSFDELSNVNLG